MRHSEPGLIKVSQRCVRNRSSLDAKLQWTFLGFGVPGAQAMLQAIITVTLSFMVFTFG
jgi:hypothetical protein